MSTIFCRFFFFFFVTLFFHLAFASSIRRSVHSVRSILSTFSLSKGLWIIYYAQPERNGIYMRANEQNFDESNKTAHCVAPKLIYIRWGNVWRWLVMGYGAMGHGQNYIKKVQKRRRNESTGTLCAAVDSNGPAFGSLKRKIGKIWDPINLIFFLHAINWMDATHTEL